MSFNGSSVISKIIPIGKASTVADTKLTEASTSDRYKQILASIKEYHSRTCIKWIRKSSADANYVNFIDGGPLRCLSFIGMIGGAQNVSIGEGCEKAIGVIIHEMAHALGFLHEHTRPDRDNYIDVVTTRIQSGKSTMFDKIQSNETDLQSLAYDYSSLMHYGNASFSTDGNPTIITKDPNAQQVIGQRVGFSVCDLEKINKKYGCISMLKNDLSCQSTDNGRPMPTTTNRPVVQNLNCKNDPTIDCSQVVANPALCTYAPGYFIFYCINTCNNCDSKICMDTTSPAIVCRNVVKPCSISDGYFCPKTCGWCS